MFGRELKFVEQRKKVNYGKTRAGYTGNKR
ncbi:hypothetical protein QFZ51_001434 [Chitinophaga sp. W3I9]